MARRFSFRSSFCILALPVDGKGRACQVSPSLLVGEAESDVGNLADDVPMRAAATTTTTGEGAGAGTGAREKEGG